jgi:CRP/FNR family transcriptional regulator, cyclic AMP receptor protein
VLEDILWNVPARKTVTAGEYIFQVGDPANVLYVVAEGEVEIAIGEHIIEVVGREGVFGEMALIDDKARSATAKAKTNCVLVPITRNHFFLLLRARPDFAIEVMRVMSKRIRSLDAETITAS